MNCHKLVLGILVLCGFLLSRETYSQQIQSPDSLKLNITSGFKRQPQLHYSLGSSFTYIPRYGSISGITFSPFLSYPLTPKVSIEAGLIAGRYFQSMKNVFPESQFLNSFNALSVFGSATYHLNERLSFYGAGLKQLGNSMPLYNFPSSSFTVGSTLNFGNFSIGAAIRMDNWSNNNFLPLNGNRGYFPTDPL